MSRFRDTELVQICREAADANRAYMVAAEVMPGNIDAGAEPFESLHGRFVERTHQAIEVPSVTMEGLRAKAALIQACPEEDDMPALALSLASDVMRLLPSSTEQPNDNENDPDTVALSARERISLNPASRRFYAILGARFTDLEGRIVSIADAAEALTLVGEESLGGRSADDGKRTLGASEVRALLFLIYEIRSRSLKAEQACHRAYAAARLAQAGNDEAAE